MPGPQGRFHGRHVIVTGGSSGIGLATVRRFVAEGAAVSVLAGHPSKLDGVFEVPPPLGRAQVDAEAVDVRDDKAVIRAVAACVERNGPCDVLVTSAGVTLPAYFEEFDGDEFHRQMDVNYFGTVHAIRAVLPSMLDRGDGSIVAISSAAGLIAPFGYGAYAPSKFAVRALCEVLRLEVGDRGVRVTCVFPADVDTPMLEHEVPLQPPETRALTGKVKPIPPERVADAVLDAVITGRRSVYTDWKMPLLARFAGVAPDLSARLMERIVARGRPRPGGRGRRPGR